MSVRVTTPATLPDAELLARVKLHLHITNTADDTILSEQYIPAAIEVFEQETGRSLFDQTIKQSFDCFPDIEDFFLLEQGSPLALDGSGDPVSLDVNYYDTDGTLTVWDAANYDVIKEGVPVLIGLAKDKSWPSDIHATRKKAVEVNYQAGYGTTVDDIPKRIMQAISLMCGDMMNFKEDSLYSPGGTIVENLNTNSRRMLDYYRTGFYEWRSQKR